jgi:peptide chain release factor 3
VVGRLQFEVISFRLQSEYGVETRLEPLPFSHIRWLEGAPDALKGAYFSPGSRHVEDGAGNPAVLFESDWSLNYTAEKNPDVCFLEAPPGTPVG